MGIRRRNRPVSAAVAGGPFTPDTGPPDARPAGPCARDPPLPVFGELPELPTDRERAMAHPPGEDPPHPRPKKGEAMQQHRLTQRRTREASPSYS